MTDSSALAATTPLTFIPDIPYADADGQPLLLDIMAPQQPFTGQRLAVILIHGGGWTLGSRRGRFEITCCSLLAAHGFVTASIDYRLSDKAVFPAQIHDLKAAIRWVRAHAKTYGIDPDRIGLVGHSAGGHLAALAALTADDPDLEGKIGITGISSQVQAVVIGSPATNFLRTGGLMINDAPSPVTQLFGGTVAEHEALMRRASPVTYAPREAPPFLITHGTLDETVPFDQAEALHAALVAAGATVTFVPLQHAYHNLALEMQPIDGSDNVDEIGRLALPFFQQHLCG